MSDYSRDKHLGVKFHRDFQTKLDKRKPVKGFWRKKFVEFCKRTDLHGFKYIVMEGLSSVERSCWAIAVLMSTIFAAYFVYAAYKWYARNPIVTVIESTQGAIWDIPFPAITICDLNAISKKRARDLSNNIILPPNITSDYVFEAFRFAPLIHSPYISNEDQKEQLKILQKVVDLNKMTLDKLFRDLSPAQSCTNLLQRCMWKNTIYRCDHLFQQVMTMYKLCCAFNYYAVLPDVKEYQEQPVTHSEPRRVASCGYQTALTVLLKTDPDDYYSALVPSQGALVFIDSAYNIPNQDSPTRLVNPSTEVLIALSPERTYTTSGIRSFPPEQRECYYNDEVKIGEFRRYSLHNCIAYQRVEIIKRVCDCIPYYFPIKDYPRICSFNDIECLENTLRPRNDQSMPSVDKTSPFTCLPECEHYDYPMETAMGKLATNMQLTGLQFFNNIEIGNRSLLNVFFNDLVSTRFRRDVYFNWQNFTAAFGGLLSLMLGFTLIAGFDLILFFTVRLVYDLLPCRNTQVTNIHGEEEKKRINNWVQSHRFPENELGMWKGRKTVLTKY